jgi:hypothetical protein
MSRSIPEAQRLSNSTDSKTLPLFKDRPAGSSFSRDAQRVWGFWVVRLFLTVCTAAVSYTLGPFGLRGMPAAGVGALLALAVLLAELRLRQAALSGLLGGALGTVLGMFAALLVTLVVARTSESEQQNLSWNLRHCLLLAISDSFSVRAAAVSCIRIRSAGCSRRTLRLKNP